MSRALVRQLDKIEESVNGMKMPLAYAEQFYVLREHIGFVRARLTGTRETPDAGVGAEAQQTAQSAEEAEAPEGRSNDAGTAGTEASHANESGGNETGERTH